MLLAHTLYYELFILVPDFHNAVVICQYKKGNILLVTLYTEVIF